MNNRLATIYLVRHGESESNVNADKDPGFHSQWGELESPLTKLGEEQAKKRADTLKHVHFDSIFASDLTRAKQTAEFIALERKIAVQTTNLIRERSFEKFRAAFPGKSREEIKELVRKELHHLDEQAKRNYKVRPELESAEEAATRLIRFLREVAVAYLGKTVLVVNHGNNMRSLLTHLGYAKFDELPSGSIDNTAYIILESDGVNFFVKETDGVHKKQGDIRFF